jgi:hypothetical protein
MPDEGAQVGRAEPQKVGTGDRFAAVAAEELNEPMCGGNVRPNRVRRPPPIVLQISGPARGKLARRRSI